MPSDLRGYLYVVFLHALRDVESDISNWRRSPLRKLLEAAAAAVPDEELSGVRQAMKDANTQLNDLEVIQRLGGNISTRILKRQATHLCRWAELPYRQSRRG